MQTSIARKSSQAPDGSIDWSNPDAFRARLVYAIKTSGVKQEAIAMALRLDPSAISHWISGAKKMPAEWLVPLIQQLGDSGLRLLDENVSRLGLAVAVLPTTDVFFAPEYLGSIMRRAYALAAELAEMAMMSAPRPVYKMRGHAHEINRLITGFDALLDAMPVDSRQAALDEAMGGGAA